MVFCFHYVASPAPRNNDDDGYDLVIPRLILFVVIPVVIVLILMVAIPVLSLWVWRLCKLRRMKDRLTIAETVRTGDDTLEHGRLTRGTFHNTHADTSFSVADQTLPQSQQTSPALQTSPYVPRFPAPPPPTSYQQQQPPPPPPPELQSDALESTSEVAVDVQLPSNMPPARFLGDRTSTISGAFDVLAAVTAAEAKKRHSTVSGDGPSSITRSSSSAFRRWERPTTPPPPPPPPTNGAPAIPPKPNSPTRHLMGQQPPAATGEEDETDEPLYEPIPGDQPEAVTGHQVTAGGDDDDTYVIDNIQQSPSTSDQDDTYDIPIPYSNSPPYEIMTSSNSAPPPRPPKPNKSQNPLDQLVQEEDPVNQEAEFDREVSNSSQIDDTYEVLDLNDND